MSEVVESYNSFIHLMWIKNCDERQEWSQPKLTKEEYTRANGTFLEDSFWMAHMGNKHWDGKRYA